MSAGIATTQFRQGAGRLSLDFTRTLRHRGRPTVSEELADPDALRDWVNQFGPWRADPFGLPLPAGQPDRTGPARTPTMARVRQARRLREAIVELVTAARDDGSCPPEVRDLVNHAASRPVPVPNLDGAGRLSWLAGDPISATLALVARDALDLVSSTAIDRVHGCANPDCAALFFDGSRPGSRRWCSMGSCGNIAKKANLARKDAGPG